jgi:hypothetical protein
VFFFDSLAETKTIVLVPPPQFIIHSFDFFVKFDDSSYSFFLEKYRFKDIPKLYYMVDDILVKINNYYDFFNKMS